jgi:hypothetical protein
MNDSGYLTYNNNGYLNISTHSTDYTIPVKRRVPHPTPTPTDYYTPIRGGGGTPPPPPFYVPLFPKKCCVADFKVYKAGEEISDTTINVLFNMYAKFSDTPPPCKCECCEYRQYTRGYAMVNGEVVKNTTEYEEDREKTISGFLKGTYYGYGHRDHQWSYGNTYTSDAYNGWDAPGFYSPPIYPAQFMLSFRGRIVDICLGGITVRQKEWYIETNYAKTSKDVKIKTEGFDDK